jgi:hypothetical protein
MLGLCVLKEVMYLNVPVIYSDTKYGEIKSFQLDKLISLGMVKKFYRSGNWINVREDKIRGHGGIYTGPERRKKMSVVFL